MNLFKKIAALLIAAIMLALPAACSGNKNNGGSEGTATAAPANNGGADPIDDPSNDDREATGAFAIAPSGSVRQNGNVYTITAAGEYTISGKLADGQIIVSSGSGDEVKLILNNASISCSTAAPIVCVSADKLKVKAEEGSYNTVHDNRSEIADDEEYDAAICSDCDLDLVGRGTLIVTSQNACGIKTKDDLSVKNITAKITAESTAMRGNDSVNVESGELILVSNGDGIKTSNSDISKKGNQKGSVVLSGGSIDIYSAQDGISAAYNVEISSDSCTLNIYTADYAEHGGEEQSSNELYLAVPSKKYSEGNDYYFFFYNDSDSDGVWVKAEYETKIYSGRTASYYGLKAEIPGEYRNMLINIVASGTEPDGSNYSAASEGETINTAMNCYVITSIADGKVAGDWAKLSSSSGSKTTYSSKGIKADNDIIISGGNVSVKSMDDALHANSGEKLDSGAVSTGNVTVSGGNLYIECADDGIHADGNLTIDGGNINIKESHEGIEANVITVNDGVLYINGQDDGMNAGKGNSTPLISINGGYVDVTTPSGDTDAIDSNGHFAMSGGFAVIRCGAAMGGMAGSVDVDGKITVTGGTIIAVGGICETPESGSACTYISGGTSLAPGSYTLTDDGGNVLASFELSANYNSIWLASDKMQVNGNYSLKNGETELLSWTQSSETVGSAGNGGMYGPGGRH